MIRINLAADRKTDGKKSGKASAAATGGGGGGGGFQTAYLFLGIFSIFAVALCGLAWWWKDSQIGRAHV